MKTRAEDEELLRMLDMRDHQRLSARQIAARTGLSRGTICGALFRIDRDADAVPCRCRRKANRDGGMPRGWWAA